MKTIQLPDELYKRAAAQVEPGRSVEEQIIAWLTEAVLQQEATAQFFRARRTGRPREEAAASGQALLLQLAERQREAQAEESVREA
jgi:hypothetical protein